MTTNIACFISPHGFGHATRTIALLSALHEIIPDLQARLVTTVPDALFKTSSFPFTYHPLITDVGLVQNSALTNDLRQSLKSLSHFVPAATEVIQECAEICQGCRLILCDISILGILVGKQVGVPSVLVENFTWDWIYEHLEIDDTALQHYADYFKDCYHKADYRIQTEPLCQLRPNNLLCPPIARQTLLAKEKVVELLDTKDRFLVLITMGGIPLDLPFLGLLSQHPEYLFVLAGQRENLLLTDNVMLLSHTTDFHHPDLIQAADLLVCKSGYSTIAECAQTSTPICCVKRTGFAESAVLESWITNRMNGCILDPEEFFSGSWLQRLPALLKQRREPEPQNGAPLAAAFMSALLQG